MPRTYTPRGPRNNLMGGRGYTPGGRSYTPTGPRNNLIGGRGYTPPRSATNPSAASSSAPPFNAALEARRASLEARRNTLLSDADVDLQQTSQEYGFNYNPATGAFGGFDPTNPFSQAALLAKTRDENVSRTSNSYASRGQRHSTAYDAAQKEVGRRYDQGYDTLRRGFDDYVKRYLRRKRDISTVNPEELASL